MRILYNHRFHRLPQKCHSEGKTRRLVLSAAKELIRPFTSFRVTLRVRFFASLRMTVILSSVKICVICGLIVFLPLTGFSEKEPKKLSVPLKTIPLKDRENLQNILTEKTAFLNWRDEEIETTVKLFDYLFNRPVLTSTILTELGIAQYRIESHGSYYIFDDNAGLTGELKMLYKKDGERIYQGTYVYTTGAGIPVRLSGELALILKYKLVPESLNQGNKEEMLKIDIDLYLKSDEEKLSKITKDFPFIIKAIMLEKVNSYIESLRELCESIRDDPDDAYEVLQESGEIKEKDLKEFQKAIGGKR